MAADLHITLPDGSTRVLPDGATARDLAAQIGPGLAKAAIAARVNGEVRDLARPLPDGASVAILTDKDPQALDVLRHSAAHVLATWGPRQRSTNGPSVYTEITSFAPRSAMRSSFSGSSTKRRFASSRLTSSRTNG